MDRTLFFDGRSMGELYLHVNGYLHEHLHEHLHRMAIMTGGQFVTYQIFEVLS